MKKYFRSFFKKRINAHLDSEMKNGNKNKKEDIEFLLKEVIANSSDKEIVFLCIGSDLVVVDSLGPLVGTMLVEHGVPFHVFGTLEDPIHALNLKKRLNDIKKQFQQPLIIAVDACIGDKDQLGSIIFEKGPLFPGIALGKSLPSVGDYQIKAVVGCKNIYEPSQIFQNTRLYHVINTAKEVTEMIVDCTQDDDVKTKS